MEYEDAGGSKEERSCTPMRYDVLGHLCDKTGQNKSICPKSKMVGYSLVKCQTLLSKLLNSSLQNITFLNAQIFKTSLIHGDCESAKPLKITRNSLGN